MPGNIFYPHMCLQHDSDKSSMHITQKYVLLIVVICRKTIENWVIKSYNYCVTEFPRNEYTYTIMQIAIVVDYGIEVTLNVNRFVS